MLNENQLRWFYTLALHRVRNMMALRQRGSRSSGDGLGGLIGWDLVDGWLNCEYAQKPLGRYAMMA
jgi:hypothetical protein